MTSTEWAISSDALVLLFVALLYGAAGFSSFRWLLPRLSRQAKWTTVAFFVAQVALLVVAPAIEAATGYERWLWDLDQERNIPATFAAVQLALVGGIATLTALRGGGGGGLLVVESPLPASICLVIFSLGKR